MAFNKNSNGFTFIFSIIMVLIVGTVLAVVSMALKPMQKANEANQKRMDILKSIGIEADSKNAEAEFNKYIVERTSFSGMGKVVEQMTGEIKTTNKQDPFNINVKKDYKNFTKKVLKDYKGDREACAKALMEIDINYPMYKAIKNDTIIYIIPCAGTGLWGPIWGFVALEDDLETIYGTAFDHKGETPGLGAPIKKKKFQSKFKNKTINLKGEKAFEVVKASVPDGPHSIQGITGGTITSRGVGEMVDRTLTLYKVNFDELRKAKR